MKHINKVSILMWALLFVILISSISVNVYLLFTMGDNTPIKQQSTNLESNIKDHLDKTLKERLLSEEKVRGLIEEYVESGRVKVIDNTKDVVHGRDGIDGTDGVDGSDGESVRGEKGDRGEDGRDGKDGYTPVKGIDYFDGEPIFVQCNVEINAWQQRVSSSSDWELLNDRLIPCTPS